MFYDVPAVLVAFFFRTYLALVVGVRIGVCMLAPKDSPSFCTVGSQ